MDQQELREKLTALHPASFSWAVACCRGDRDRAEDVLQSAYVAVLDGRSRFDGRSSFRTWLFAVIRNTAKSHARRNWWLRIVNLKLDSVVALFTSAAPVEEVLDTQDDIAAIRTALGRLPPRQQEVVHLVFYEGLSIAESAEIMQVSIGTARQHYARAKESLRTRLNDLAHSTSPTDDHASGRSRNPKPAPTPEG